jgi:hypothetical protein
LSNASGFTMRRFPLRRFLQAARWNSTCCQAEPASHEVVLPFRVFNLVCYRPYWLGVSFLFFPLRVNFKAFASQVPRKSCEASSAVLSWTYTLLQSTPRQRAAASARNRVRRSGGSSLEVFVPYSVSPPGAAVFMDRGCLARAQPAPSGFLNLLTLSSAPNLLALFHASSAHGVRPSELSSSHTAVRCLQRLCPLDVGSARRASRPSQHRVASECASVPNWPYVTPAELSPASGLCSA